MPESPPRRPTKPLQPFKVAEVVVTSLEALLSAAALHLGDAMPDGRALPRGARDPQEAWHALVAAGGMLDRLEPMMQPETFARYRDRLAALADRLAAAHPNDRFPAPGGARPS